MLDNRVFSEVVKDGPPARGLFDLWFPSVKDTLLEGACGDNAQDQLWSRRQNHRDSRTINKSTKAGHQSSLSAELRGSSTMVTTQNSSCGQKLSSALALATKNGESTRQNLYMAHLT